MIEAMACGTPVIAYNRGSVPEIIDDGLTGFVVEDETSAVASVGRLSELDRGAIRKQFETRFTARRMALDYLAAYRGLMEAAKPRIKLVAARNSHPPDRSAGTRLTEASRPCQIVNKGVCTRAVPAYLRSPEIGGSNAAAHNAKR